jgi:hypothetical protein
MEFSQLVEETFINHIFHPEFPVDGTLHIYTKINHIEQTVTGILISNNRLSNLVVETIATICSGTDQTIELISIITNIYNVVSQYYNTTKSLNLHIHCKNIKTYKSMKQHQTQLYSPKQCLSQDWDKLQEISKLKTSFQSVVILDTTKEHITTHSAILEDIEDNLHQPTQSNVNKKSRLQMQQLGIKGQVITNKHVCTKTNWSNSTFASIAWIPHGNALQQL